MRNSDSQIGEGRYVELHDGSLLLRERDREKLNDRLAWLPEAERGRILEEAWFNGPEVYDRIDDSEEGDEVTQIWRPRIENKSTRILEILKLEGIRAQTSELARECVDEVLIVVDELRNVVCRHARAFIISAGLATGASIMLAALNSNPIPVAHASEQAPENE